MARHHGILSGTDPTTRWKHISDKSILDLASKGRLEVARLKKYMAEGRVTSRMILKRIDFSDPLEGAKILKKYYHMLFLNG